MKKAILFPALMGLMLSGCLQAQSSASDVQMNAFIDDLMSRMTLPEKSGN
jgi:hypothetical protein